jgi:recombination protein RecA
MPKKIKQDRSEFMELLIKEFGEDLVDDFIEKEESIEDIKSLSVIKTGSISLDVSLGVGGIPRGRITTIYGPESSAKTTLCLSIAKNALENGIKVLYVDQENSCDYSYINAIVGSVDPSMFTLVQPETAEQTLMTCEAGINSGEYGLIVLDSVGALSPQKEKEDPFDKGSVGQIPRLMSKFLRRNAFAIRNKNIAFVIVNQVRAVIGAYVPTLEMPGGNALRHFSSVVIFMHRSVLIKYGEEVVGANSAYTIKKSKVGKPFKSWSFPLIYGTGIDTERDVVEFAKRLGILTAKGSFLYLGEEGLGQGLAKAEQYLKDHPETLAKIESMCYTMNGNIVPEIEEERSEEVGEITTG